jgi:hypothetical protein
VPPQKTLHKALQLSKGLGLACYGLPGLPLYPGTGAVVLTRASLVRRATNGPPQAPASFYCPVSMELMSDPVMVATGHTYDRTCIERWLQQGNRTCPVTGMRLRHLELTPNHALRNAIQVRLLHRLNI